MRIGNKFPKWPIFLKESKGQTRKLCDLDCRECMKVALLTTLLVSSVLSQE